MSFSPRPYRVAVVGGASADGEDVGMAHDVGVALGRSGAVVVCGGHGGVMEGAARGAHEAGGQTIGVLPGTRADDANPWITLPLPTGMGEARNALVVRMAEAVIAIGGEWGTLSEIALARKMGIPVCTLGRPPAEALKLEAAENPAAAVAWALEQAANGRKSGV